jgi:drug/metabolite transporter (DMT)-like permease
MAASGVLFAALNAISRLMSLQMHPIEALCLRYGAGALLMLPIVLRAGFAAYRPRGLPVVLGRGAVHASGLMLWFIALPHIPLADTTAIGFTNPIFIMLGAALMMGERLVPARWVAAVVGMVGVLVVLWPKLSGETGFYGLLMLATSPIFAVSYLLAKYLSRRNPPEVIVVWQSVCVALFTLPVALANWTWPTAEQWAITVLAGVIGTMGHYAMNSAIRLADLSVTQPIRYLELVWASLLGVLVFGDIPGVSVFLGGAIIFVSASAVARWEARRPRG